MIIGGAVVTFFGRKFFKYTAAVVGGFMTFLIVMLLCSIFHMLERLEGNPNGSIGLLILAFVLGIGLAVGAGFLLYRFTRVGALILAACAGFFLGITLYNIAFHWINNLYVMLGLAFGLAIVLGYLSFKIFDKVLIFGTALLGSYAFVRGISLFAGHFPNEVLMMQQLSEGHKPHFDNYFYAYMAGIAVLFLCGSVFQMKRFEKEENEDNYHKL